MCRFYQWWRFWQAFPETECLKLDASNRRGNAGGIRWSWPVCAEASLSPTWFVVTTQTCLFLFIHWITEENNNLELQCHIISFHLPRISFRYHTLSIVFNPGQTGQNPWRWSAGRKPGHKTSPSGELRTCQKWRGRLIFLKRLSHESRSLRNIMEQVTTVTTEILRLALTEVEMGYCSCCCFCGWLLLCRWLLGLASYAVANNGTCSKYKPQTFTPKK